MAQVHVKLDDKAHKELKKLARAYNYSIQELAEKALNLLVKEPQTLFSSSTQSINIDNSVFTFIDLFAGIGGIRLAAEEHGGACVFSSEWDRWCQKTYFENFGEMPEGDINKIDIEKEIPDHDILTAGFPCQPFSIAGVSKKNSLGREHGFKDKTQGTLFFKIAEILDKKRPKAFLLENVKNLQGHDKGNTFKIIRGTLEELGYVIDYKVLDAINYVPQHRERIFIVGFDRRLFGDEPKFKFPKPPDTKPLMKSILDRKVDPKYILTDKLWQYLQNYAAKHKEKGNGFGFGIVDRNSTARTLSARYYKDGSEILVSNNGGNPRRLTPQECARLMGYGDDFKIPVSDTQAYKQFGNSVAVPVVKAVFKELVKTCKPYL